MSQKIWAISWSNRMFSMFIVFCSITAVVDGILERKQHQTNASLESKNDLSCFECSSLNTGAKCYNLSLHNKTKFHKKCKGDKKKCMVKKYSYTTSTENSTSQMKVWSLERSCTSKCEEGCIIIGERTKLHACTACCSESLCNVTNDAKRGHHQVWIPIGFLLAFISEVSGRNT